MDSLPFTPAQRRPRLDSAHRLPTRNGIAKHRPFAIYTDGAVGKESLKTPHAFSKQPPCSPGSAGEPLRSARLKAVNPLADKTNTVKKSRPFHNTLVQPSPQSFTPPKLPLAKKPILKSSASKNSLLDGRATPLVKKSVRVQEYPGRSPLSDSVHRLLYRTPVTAKHAHRPPMMFQATPGNCEQLDDHGDSSFASSTKPNQASRSFSLDADYVPDVEYGPPSAIVEPVELPAEICQLSELLDAIEISGERQMPLCDNSIDDDSDWRERIMQEDGKKDDWHAEPAVKLSSQPTSDVSLDELCFPWIKPLSRPGDATLQNGTMRSLRASLRSATTSSRLRPAATTIISKSPNLNQPLSMASTAASRLTSSQRPTISSHQEALRHSKRPLPSHRTTKRCTSSVQTVLPIKSASSLSKCYQELLESVVESERCLLDQELDNYLLSPIPICLGDGEGDEDGWLERDIHGWNDFQLTFV